MSRSDGSTGSKIDIKPLCDTPAVLPTLNTTNPAYWTLAELATADRAGSADKPSKQHTAIKET